MDATAGPGEEFGPAAIPFGYLDKWTARPSERLDVMVESDLSYEASIVRLLQGDRSEQGPGVRETVQEWWGPVSFPPRRQETATGSLVVTDAMPALAEARRVEVGLRLCPTLPDRPGAQVVVTLLSAEGRPSLELALTESDQFELRIGDGTGRRRESSAGAPVRAGRWYEVRLFLDLDEQVVAVSTTTLDRAPSGPASTELRIGLAPEERAALAGPLRPARLVLGAAARAGEGVAGRAGPRFVEHFDGKVEAPCVSGRCGDGPAERPFRYSWLLGPVVKGAFIDDESEDRVPARLVNSPTPAVTGHSYDGEVVCFLQAPEQYAALALHSDDLEDAAWETTATVELPESLASGAYAVKLASAAGTRYLPFFVAPGRQQPRAPIAVVLSTFTYLAYANEHVRESVPLFEGGSQQPSRQDLEISAHREFGLSLYDRHVDGTGVCFSSWRRPVLNLDPSYRFWLFGAPVHLGEDLYLLDWLDRRGYSYDVLTDHVLHEEGRSCLEGYRVVLTGSHPEYASARLLDALEEHVEGGGRLMYLGGNGFYWVTSVDPSRPHLIEVRRGNAGGRSWESRPGEGYHSTTGEPGGLWRHRGRPPNKLVGVGFSAQGADEKAPGYRRLRLAEPERWAFLFDGLIDDQAIGDDGLLLGGAAGNEVDRADPEKGTPVETVVLATSKGHSDAYQLAIEDLSFTAPGQGGTEQPLVRADITVTPYASGGCVFAVGAITWLGALALDRYDNDVARLTENVLKRFLDEAPL